MLCDAGTLIAIFDHSDKNHTRCVEVLAGLRSLLVTTWLCFAEAMYVLGNYGGHKAQDLLWSYVEDRVIGFHISSEQEQQRMRVLMQKYRDTPMDLGDASLVAAAEALKHVQVFSTDSDFFVYQIGGTTPFEVVP